MLPLLLKIFRKENSEKFSNRIKSSKTKQSNVTKSEPHPPTEQLYELQKFSGNILAIAQILVKNKEELGVS